MERKLIELAAERDAALNAAQAAYDAKNEADYNSAMQRVDNLNGEIAKVKALIDEKNRKVLENVPTDAEVRDMNAERGVQLLNHNVVSISGAEILRDLKNSVTIGGTLVQPTGADGNIRDNLGVISSILDLVQVQDLTGLSGYEVPYVVSDFDGTVASITGNSGESRSNSDDPTFAISVINPVEVTTTSYVDRNIAKLSPADYYAKVQEFALRALRKKVAAMIVNGDGLSPSKMHGIKTAVNKAGSAICATDTYSSIDVNTLDELYFAYGADSELGGQATLFLKKADLKTIGELRGTNEKQRLFQITPQGNGNTGIISDGGVQIPYVLVPDLSAGDLIYGNPLHYLLGLFGGYEIRIDESVKAIQRMHTILGDVAVGGNVVEHQGFVYYSTGVSAG